MPFSSDLWIHHLPSIQNGMNSAEMALRGLGAGIEGADMIRAFVAY
jgi:hypothetical protein